jgi:predicted transcriptional regulator of viral defense system
VHHVTEHEAIRMGAVASDRLLTAAQLEVSAPAMARMEDEGVLRRVITGVYVGTQHPTHPLIEAAAWTLKHPKAVACLLTAAVYHDLTDAFERGTWLFVPFGASPPRSRVNPVHVLQVAPRLVEPDLDAEMGIETVSVHGVAVRLTSLDRTTLDLWRYDQRIPREYVLDALRRRVGAQDFEMPRFARLARRLDVWNKVEPVAQGLVLR